MKDTPLRRKLKLRQGVSFRFGTSTIPGTTTIEASHEDVGMPVATMWWRWVGNSTVEIMSMYTPSWARQCGLQAFLFERLVHYARPRRVTTASDTRYSRGWLAKRGFKRNQDRDLELVLKSK